MRSLRLALRALRREWRSGELAVLWLSLSVAAGALTGVAFLADRIGRAVSLQATEILAADLRVESDQPIADSQLSEAHAQQLATAQLTTTLSAIFNGNNNQLADVRVVTDGYPLRGQLTVADQPFANGIPTHEIPGPGETWPDSRLAAALGVRVGGTLEVGARTLRVTRILISRPDQSATFVEITPALLINAVDLASCRLIQPGSRVEYALLLAGPRGRLAAFRRWHARNGRAGDRVADVSDASPQIGQAARRAARFLALASLVAVLLSAVSIAMSARSYVRRHLDVVALMKTLGASRPLVLAVSLWQLLVLAVGASLLGAAAGWLTQLWLLRVLRGLLRSDLPAASAWPVLVGFAVALAMLAGFALPSLLQLTRVPALRVLRREIGPPTLRLWAAAAPVLLASAAVIYGALGEVVLSLWFIAGLAGCALVLGSAGALLIRLSRRVRSFAGASWRYGVAQLARRPASSIAQIIALGIGITLLLALAILRTDLVRDWRTSLPRDVPNYFFAGIPPAQREQFAQTLEAQGARLSRMLPMVRGRLVAINGQPIGSRPLATPRDRRFGEREQNLTWTAELGDDNRIIAGRWWTSAEYGQPLVSLAQEYSDRLGIKLGDRLQFDIAGESLTATVSSFRSVQWDSFHPNFFVEFPPGLLDGTAGTYLTSAYLVPTSSAMADLVHRFPSVSIFDIGDLLAQAQAVIDKAVTAVQSVFLFTLLAGLTVLLAQVQSSREERRHEIAILRVLGAQRAMVVGSVLVEFSLLGALAGVLGSSAAAGAGAWLAHTLDLHYRFDAVIWGLGIVGATLVAALAAYVATRPILRVPPHALLY
jgi:putative ABC transport system permease protein